MRSPRSDRRRQIGTELANDELENDSVANRSVGSDTTGTSNTTRFNRKIDALSSVNAALVSTEYTDLSPRILSSPSSKAGRLANSHPLDKSPLERKLPSGFSSPRQLPALSKRPVVQRAQFPSPPKLNRDKLLEQYSVLANHGVEWGDRTGSALLTYDPEHVRGVRDVTPGSRYPDRCEYFRKMQKARTEGNPMSAFTAMLLEQHRIEEEKRAAKLAEEERTRKVKLMFMRQLMGPAAEVMGAWREHVGKMKRMRAFMKKHVMGPAAACLTAWIKYHLDTKKARAFMMRFVIGALRNTYAAWKMYWQQQKKLKKLILGNLFGLKATIFHAWAGASMRGKKAVRMFKAAMSDCMSYNFGKWKDMYITNKKLKGMLLGHLIGSKRQIFIEWADVTKKTIRLRRLVSKIMHGFELSIMLAWKEAAVMLRKSRIQNKLAESRAVGTSAFFCREELLASSPFPFEPIVEGTQVALLGLPEGWATIRLAVTVVATDKRGRKTTKTRYKKDTAWSQGLIGATGVISSFSAESGYCSVILDDDGYRGAGWELIDLKLDNVETVDRSAAKNDRLARRGGAGIGAPPVNDDSTEDQDGDDSESGDSSNEGSVAVTISSSISNIKGGDSDDDSDSDTELDFAHKPIKRRPPPPEELEPTGTMIAEPDCEFDVVVFIQSVLAEVVEGMHGSGTRTPESPRQQEQEHGEWKETAVGGGEEEKDEKEEAGDAIAPEDFFKPAAPEGEAEEVDGMLEGVGIFSLIGADNVARMIQGKYRQKVARRKVAARRAEKQKQDQAAARMQAIARRRKAQQRVNELTVHGRGKWHSEYDQHDMDTHDDDHLGTHVTETLFDQDGGEGTVAFGVAHHEHQLNHEKPPEDFHW